MHLEMRTPHLFSPQGKLKASGLDSSSKDLQSVVAQAGKIARRNFAIHGPIYIKLLRDFAISKQ
jgi:hypothetical protein